MPLFKRKKPQISRKGSQTTPGSPQVLHNGSFRNQGSTESEPDHFLSANALPVLSEAELSYNASQRMRTKSRLSKTLSEFLEDHVALAYFIQYMDTQNAKHFVKFWLETESFRSAVLMRRTHSSNPEGSSSAKDSQHPPQQQHPQGMESISLDSVDTDSVGSQSLAPTSAADLDSSQGSMESPSDYGSGHRVEPNGTSVASSISSMHGREKLETSSEEDAWHLYQKYLSEDAPLPVGLPSEIVAQVHSNISETDLNPDCFVPAQNEIQKKLEADFFPGFLRSSFHCKHQLDVLTSGQVYLADILYNDSTLFYFMEFMEQESVRHLVDFLLMAENFRHLLLEQSALGDSELAQSDAIVIYDKYFSLQATSPLGLSDTVRFEVEQGICCEGGLRPDCFLKPVMVLLQHIERKCHFDLSGLNNNYGKLYKTRDTVIPCINGSWNRSSYLELSYLKQFIHSQLYFKYLSECIMTIQMTGLEHGHRKRSGSESSSSEVSSQTANTLLATGSRQQASSAQQQQQQLQQQQHRVLRNIGEQDMRIDTGQFEPDTLWKRNLSGRLQMAHVDAYGKLTTEFEPEPDRKTGSRLTKAMKKFVNWEDDKTQEVMAWQVAEMIVKDVCNLTLGPQNDSHKKAAAL